MWICRILGPYYCNYLLDHGHRQSISVTVTMLLSFVTRPMHCHGGTRLSNFVLLGPIIANENSDLPYFGGLWTDYQCHSGTTITIYITVYIYYNSSTTTGNSTYTPCQMSPEDIVNTHDTFMKSFGIELSDDDKRLPYLYWTPKLHKSPVKHRFIAGSSKCTTKQLSSLLTKILTVIKTGLEKYCSIKTSHTGVNNMWILKISTNLLSY